MSSHCWPSSSSKARAAGSSPLRFRPLVRTIVNRPLTFWPWRTNFSSPSSMARRGSRVGRLGLPGAPVPDDHVAGAVLLRRDHALEIEVLDRVVLDVDGHPPDRRIERQALRDGPADEDAFDLEAEVVVEPRGAMALDDESPGRARDDGRCRFRGLPEVAFAAVFVEGHDVECAERGAAAQSRRDCLGVEPSEPRRLGDPLDARSRGPRAAGRCHRPLPGPRPPRRRRGSAARGGR